MNDTTPEMRKKQLELVFRMTPKERFQQGLEMIAFVRQTVENSILKQNPNLTAAELKVEVFKRYYGKEFSAEEQQRIIAHLLTH
ncbi:MAG TPA: hypothetical protein DCM08_05200 [Microscillaceae bacterium]|nr:hypothetical protein [Microscillaceae bacterium]